MPNLIDPSEFVSIVDEHIKRTGVDVFARYHFLDFFAQCKLIDPESLRPHGRWDDKGCCTNCGQRCIGNDYEEWRTKYCPHCGAKMKGTVSLD